MKVDLAHARSLLRDVVDAFREHHLLTYASAVAFRGLVALVPLTLLGLGLLGAFGLGGTWRDSIAPAIRKKVTPQVFEGIDSTVRKIVEHGDAPLILFAAALGLWYLTAAVLAVIEALDLIHDVKDERPWWRRLAVAFGLACATGLCLVGAVLAVVAVPHAADGGAAEALLGLGRWAVSVLLLLLAVALLVRYAPAEHPGARWASAGSLLIVGSWIVASILFRLWVQYVANFKTPIGSLTLLLVLTSYLFASAVILLAGVQLDELARKKSRT